MMSVEITVPQLGESIVEATVGRWLKAEGDSIEQGEAVVELETDKVNMEVAAAGKGVLSSIIRGEGETVAIGDVLGTLDDGATSVSAPTGEQAETPADPTTAQPAPAISAGNGTQSPTVLGTMVESNGGGESARSTPLARRIASELGVDINRIEGTGPSGRVTKEDVTAFVDAAAAPVASPTASTSVAPRPAPAATPTQPAPSVDVPSRGEERVRMSRRRQTIARRLVEAQHSAAMLTTFNEVDMTAIMAIRKQRRDAFKERFGVGLGFMSFFTRAVIGALKAYPRLNAEIQGDEMILKQYYDIGIAVGAEEGLVVPVLRDADRMTFAQIEKGVAELASKARNGTLGLAELQGGTFTITNGGIFGSLLSTPILNTPQVGILGMHKIEERPIALNGEVVIRPMMYVALSYDHRIVDGSEAVRFLVHCKSMLEDPVSMLLEG
jgi:2-oxoglutarate dehydrogenase E2 component (dihydrolipoamide succinyltransferase)